MSASIERIEYHVIKGDSQFGEAVAWEVDEDDAINTCEALNVSEPGHNVFKVTSYMNNYEQIT